MVERVNCCLAVPQGAVIFPKGGLCVDLRKEISLGKEKPLDEDTPGKPGTHFWV